MHHLAFAYIGSEPVRRRIPMDANRGPQARLPWERRMMVAAQGYLRELGGPFGGQGGREGGRRGEGVDRGERGDGRVHYEERERDLGPNRGIELGQPVARGQGQGQGAGAGAGAQENNNENPEEHDQFIVEERRRGRFWGF